MSLPVTAVTLFSSGVAHVEHEGPVAPGEVRIELTFRTDQINDLLKSLVLLDEGGSALPAVYPSKDPIARTLRAFAVDLSQEVTRASLLRQLRGAPLRIETRGGETLDGALVSVETERQWRDEVLTETTVLSVLTDAGLASVELGKVALLTLKDARRDRELREALTVLAAGSDDARRTIVLTFRGETERRVRVGYITEAPLWKTTYRLVLGDAAPYLQGWALVENTSDEDWDGVRLALVSGRPISFVQDLYQPQYVARPVIGTEPEAPPAPLTHDGPIYQPMSLPLPAAPAAAPMTLLRGEALRASVPVQAAAAAVGELFRYEIDAPVSLPRQRAAMIPIVSSDLGGEKLSVYNADSDPRFPRNALRLVNTTGLHLKAGPVTVFDDGVYAGDARIEEIPPGDTRLVTYAIDLSVEGERLQDPAGQTEATLSVRRGVVTATRRRRRETTYRLRSKASKPRTVYIEHPFDTEWNLLSPDEPTERTRDRYRFATPVAPGQTATLVVVEDRTEATTISLLEGDLTTLTHYTTSSSDLPPRLREAIAVAIARRKKAQDLDAQAEEREKERATIHQEQERIRGNLSAMDRENALYKRYLGDLDRQETRLLELREEATRLRTEARGAREELRAFLDTLEVSA